MKLTVSNLGPIKQATVQLGGLTVFVGPNGTGKSYLAKVIYGLQGFDGYGGYFLPYFEKNIQTLFGKLLTTGTAQEVLTELRQLHPIALQQALTALAEQYVNAFKVNLGKFFNDDTDLFNTTDIVLSDFTDLSESNLRNIIESCIEIVNAWSKVDSNTPVLANLLFHLSWLLFVHPTHYFPAARSNFMLTYKEIYKARAEAHVGSGGISMADLVAGQFQPTRQSGKLNRFDKPTEDFIKKLYDLSEFETKQSDLADKLEDRLYGAERIVINSSLGQLPDFRLKLNQPDNQIRLHLASSLVTETSPLLIGLRHWVTADSQLIIDEPESHLHPQAQRDLINVLADAVNQGTKVILITHSPYILSCINNAIKFRHLQEKYPNDPQFVEFKANNPQLSPLSKSVTAYHFGRDGLVKDIVLESGLIDEAEFTEPFDEINLLYEAMRDIEWEHES